MAEQSDSNDGPRFPVFIVGSPRSGTSMLHWALCQHEKLWGSEESELFVPFTRHLDAVYDKARRFKGTNWLEAQQVDRDAFYAFMGAGIDALYASRAGGRHWVEQTPSNTWALPEIYRLLPDARFLFIHRDGRQIVESMTSMWRWRFMKAAKTWKEANHLAMRFEKDHPEATLRIAYENLVQDPEQELQRVWQFLGLSECRESTRFILDKDPINTSPQYAAQDRLEKLEPRYGQWSWYKRLLFGKIAGRQMRALAYGSERQEQNMSPKQTSRTGQ